MERKRDIFDKIMSLPILRIFEPFYQAHREGLLYLFFGGITTFLSLGMFTYIELFTPINELVNNVIVWIVCVLFQFFTNRTWVFESHVETWKDFFGQMASFFGGRLFTLGVEELMLLIFITWLGFNAILIKLVAQVVIVVLNYVISKLFIFKK